MILKKINPKSFDGMTSSSNKYLPSISIDIKDLPEAKNWTIGEKYYLTIEVEQKSLNLDEDGGCARFDIKSIGVMDKMPEIEKNELGGNIVDKKRNILKKYL